MCAEIIRLRILVVAIALASVMAIPSRRAAAQTASPSDRPALSVAEIGKLHDAGQYRAALQEAARTLRTPAGENDKYQLQLIRGDALLHLDDAQTALAAYGVAMKSPDAKQSDVARAMSLLIRNSQNLKYTQKKGGGAEPIDIVDHNSRPRAAAALLSDKLASDRREIDAALSADNLKPILAAVDPIVDLIALEYVATGKDEQTHALGQGVAGRARDLISRELSRLNDQVGQYQRIADQIIDDGGNGVTRRGLISTQRQELRDIVDYLANIHDVAQRGRQLAIKYHGAVDKWDGIARDSTDIGRHASDVLAAE
jgi:hypothetical protein